MMKKLIVWALGATVGAGLVGLIVGYLIFGKLGGDYVSLGTLFSFKKSVLESAFQSVAGIDAIRTRVLSCGGIGALIGLVARLLPMLKLLK